MQRRATTPGESNRCRVRSSIRRCCSLRVTAETGHTRTRFRFFAGWRSVPARSHCTRFRSHGDAQRPDDTRRPRSVRRFSRSHRRKRTVPYRLASSGFVGDSEIAVPSASRPFVRRRVYRRVHARHRYRLPVRVRRRFRSHRRHHSARDRDEPVRSALITARPRVPRARRGSRCCSCRRDPRRCRSLGWPGG